jgi:hypothetical protein
MILGRTPEGAIKIKTDDPLGLRAVECACCCALSCTGTYSEFCGGTQIKVDGGEVLTGCNDGGQFCSSYGICLFSWGKPKYGSAGLDTDMQFAFCSIAGFGFGFIVGATSPYGTYSNGVTIIPV